MDEKQRSLVDKAKAEKKGHWEKLEPPTRKDYLRLGVDEEIQVRLVSKQKSKVYPDELLYTLEFNNGDIKKMPGTSDLDGWMEQVEPGDGIKIRRLKDVNLPNQPQPKQKYEVSIWKAE